MGCQIWRPSTCIVTDRGTQFEAELLSELSKLIGFHRLRTTSYHAQANRKIERVHRTLKTALTARKQSWLDALPVVLVGIRGTPNETSYSPFTAVTGATFLLPQPMIADENNYQPRSEDIKALAQEMQTLDIARLDRQLKPRQKNSYLPKDLTTCTHAWVRVDRVRRPLEAPYSGPFLVKEKYEKFSTIQTTTGSSENVSIDRLKPAKLTVPLSNRNDNDTKIRKTSKQISKDKKELSPLPDRSSSVPPSSVVARASGKRRVKFRLPDCSTEQSQYTMVHGHFYFPKYCGHYTTNEEDL